MRYEMRQILRLGSAALILGLSACVSTDEPGYSEVQQAPPRNMRTLDQVFAPMTGQDVHVLADVVEVDMSRELYVRGSYPAGSTDTYVVSREEGSPSVRTFMTLQKNGIYSPVKFKIGSVTFHAVRGAVLRLYGKGEARFDLVARGAVAILRKGKQPQKVDKLEIRDGKWTW